MSEMLNETTLMKTRRGSTLKVLAILSWIWIGFMTLMTLPSVFSGPMSADEMEDAKVDILTSLTPEMIKILGQDFVKENIAFLEKSNEYHYSILGINLASYVLGFYAVFLMYNLKKTGYYLYVVYSLIPVVTPLLFFDGGIIRAMSIAFGLVFAILFCILYGVQVKRMS